jgi:hypothetical protein
MNLIGLVGKHFGDFEYLAENFGDFEMQKNKSYKEQ